jgi:hypothetical protein
MSDTERDPAKPTREELLETAASEGIAFSEEETDPGYSLREDPNVTTNESAAPE